MTEQGRALAHGARRSAPPHRSPRPTGVIMSFASIVMMIVAIVTVWGGLAAAIVNLRRHPENDD